NERLEAVAELSASLAHEIKNPLASIRSATEQLARRHEATRKLEKQPATAEQDDDADDERVLHTLVVREADRLSRLLSEFLDFARAQVARFVPLDAGNIVRRAAQLAIAHPDRVNAIDVTVAVSPESLEMDGDEDLLHRAVFNLVLNAVQAASVRPDLEKSGGHVHIDVRVAREETATSRPRGIRWDGDTIVIAISDDGPGIPESVRNTLFEPFVTTKSGGSGLGLPVVHRAIDAHHGLVVVDALEAGSRFTILLPRLQERVTAATAEHQVVTAMPKVGVAVNETRITGVAA
ncbi:MAG: ATP-binding protein, partial [Gemmatimonadaceae bacterium]